MKGAYFSSGSDCEVIIPLYQKFGACAEMVRVARTLRRSVASLGGAGLGSGAAPAVSGARPPVAAR